MMVRRNNRLAALGLWAGTLALLCLQSAAEPPPQEVVDRDGDGVPNDQDICPDEWGTSENMGCPVLEEVKVIYKGRELFAVLCPDGDGVAHVSECQGFSEWGQEYATVEVTNYDPDTRTVDNPADGEPCGSDVDAKCRCGAGKVKVYDETNNEFHCYDEPPADGCPNWDQDFDFDLDVWACATRPFDKDPKVAADRLRKCMPNGMFNAHWDSLRNLLEYDPGLPGLGKVECSMVDGKPVTTAIKINLDMINRGSTTIVPGSSPWAWLADVLTHEAYHYDDFQKYNYCWKMWTRFSYSVKLKQENYTVDEAGMEAYTNNRAWKDYHNELGVRAPEDPRRRTSANTQLPCTLER